MRARTAMIMANPIPNRVDTRGSGSATEAAVWRTVGVEFTLHIWYEVDIAELEPIALAASAAEQFNTHCLRETRSSRLKYAKAPAAKPPANEIVPLV